MRFSSLSRIQSILFFSTIFFISSQFGKHFWPPFTKVDGIRVDYLSPTLYVSDITIAILFFIVLIDVLCFRQQYSFTFFKNKLFLLFCILLGISVLSSLNLFAALFGLVKMAEFIFFGWYTATFFAKKDIPPFSPVFLITGILVSVLSFWQFVLQHSVGGLLYFWGERTFGTTTPGVAVFHLGNSLLLRPYATFPHPNVLAFFLLLASCFVLLELFRRESKMRGIYLAGFIIITAALALTFSRVIILAAFIFFMFFLLYKKTQKWILAILFLLGAGVIGVLLPRFLDIGQDIFYRNELFVTAIKIISQKFWLGTGLNNYFYHEILYQKTISPTLLQPPHNIHVLVLLQAGILGFFIWIYFLCKTIREQYKNLANARKNTDRDFNIVVLFLLVSVIIIGIFDHFLLTLQQGQLMTALLLGLAWSRIN